MKIAFHKPGFPEVQVDVYRDPECKEAHTQPIFANANGELPPIYVKDVCHSVTVEHDGPHGRLWLGRDVASCMIEQMMISALHVRDPQSRLIGCPATGPGGEAIAAIAKRHAEAFLSEVLRSPVEVIII